MMMRSKTAVNEAINVVKKAFGPTSQESIGKVRGEHENLPSKDSSSSGSGSGSGSGGAPVVKLPPAKAGKKQQEPRFSCILAHVRSWPSGGSQASVDQLGGWEWAMC